ncbi:uncharacterized protein TNCV_4029821 [Trichonephila clavipes]|nr:uncharacterized protein TNCV_4029821 [Trichonephila clavipes]
MASQFGENSLQNLCLAFIQLSFGPWVAWWLEHQTPDRKAWVQCLIRPNTLRVHTKCMLVKSVGPKVLWAESRVQETGEYFPPFQSRCKIVEVEIGGVAIYRPIGEFRQANSYCHLYGAQGLGQGCPTQIGWWAT